MREWIKKHIIQHHFPHVQDLVTEFTKTDWYTVEQIEEYQQKKLHQLIQFAYEHVPYYHRVFTELNIKPEDIATIADLSRLPILTKEIIWREGANMRADIPFPGVKINSTSGSTGKALALYKNSETREVEQALMIRYKRNGGVSELKQGMRIWGSHSRSMKAVSHRNAIAWLMNERVYDCYDLNEKNVEEIIRTLMTGKIYYLRGYTSTIFYIAQIMNQRNLHLEIPFVSVTAEQLYDFQRAEIEKAMGHNLYNQYGCGECGALAMECSAHSGLHHAFEHSVLEVLDNNNCPAQSGRVVITNLDNYAMPFIRYENGDMVTLANHECTCGRQSVLIDHIDGRKYEIIEGEPGRFVHAGFFDECFLKINLIDTYKIRQLRIVQKEPTMFCAQYVAEESIDEQDKEALQKEYRQMLGESVVLQFERKDMIKSSESGKRHFVIPLVAYKKNPQLYD